VKAVLHLKLMQWMHAYRAVHQHSSLTRSKRACPSTREFWPHRQKGRGSYTLFTRPARSGRKADPILTRSRRYSANMVKLALLVVLVALLLSWGESQRPQKTKSPTTHKPTKAPTVAASEGIDSDGKDWINKRRCAGFNKTSTSKFSAGPVAPLVSLA
jgi:hypothetical protein